MNNFIIQKNKLYNRKVWRALPSKQGPKASLVSVFSGVESALPRDQMLKQSSAYTFFDIMEKVLLEQG